MNKLVLIFKICFIFLFNFCGVLAFSEAQFSGGSEYEAFLLSSRIQIECREGAERNYVNTLCREEILNPGEYTNFMGPKLNEEVELKIKAIHENGKSKSKTLKYDSLKGMGKKPINLWIQTVLQKPLLDFGTNRIQWKLVNSDKNIVEQGEFVVQVHDKGELVCPSDFYYSNRSDDCRFTQSICRHHFKKYQYCQ